MTLLDMQKAFIRKTVVELVARQSVSVKNIATVLAKKLQPNSILTVDEKQYINSIVFTMISDGDINVKSGMLETKTRYRLNSVEEDYYLNVNEETHKHLNVEGDTEVYTVGSERKPYLWARLNNALPYQVTLVPEPQNFKDPNAIAVCINGQPFSYFPRDLAEHYSPVLNQIFKYNIVLTTKATILEHPDNKGLECFKLRMPDVSTIVEQLSS
jgi:hypothetical protein